MEPTDLFEQAVQHHRTGDLTRAEQLYRRVLGEHADHAPAASNLGVVLAARGNLVQAEKLYRTALQIQPNFADAHVNLANLLRRMNRIDEAIAEYRAALQSPNPPGMARRNLWQLFFEQGRNAEAVEHLYEYTRTHLDDAEAWHLLGLAHMRLGRTTEAIAPIQRAIALNPGHALAHNSLGIVTEAGGDPDTAASYFYQAIRLDPKRPEAFNNLAMIRVEQGRAPEAVDLFRHSLAIAPGQPFVYSNYLLALNYLPETQPGTVLAEHRRWAAAFADNAPPVGRLHRPNPDGVLHIGYVSADFRVHPVSAYVGAVLPAHDRAAVRVTCYASVAAPDAVTQRLRAAADEWRDIVSLSDSDAAELIRRDRVDVLVDLCGHTSRQRLGVFARRAAPVQVTHFGYPNTTGLKAIDYRLTDSVADPPGMEVRYVEQLMRMPDVAWCWRPPDEAPDVGPLPADATGAVTFGSLNNTAKLSEQVIALWARLVAAVPGSRLVVLGSRSRLAQQRILDLFAGHGVGGRVDVLSRMTPPEYFAAYNRIDIALDPFPYNGGVTTCDALWMGVPVLSVVGTTYAGRQGLSVLSALGLPEFAAAMPDDSIAIASRWANDRDRLRAVRAGLRERLRVSPILDAPRFTRNLEAAYRAMVRAVHSAPGH